MSLIFLVYWTVFAVFQLERELRWIFRREFRGIFQKYSFNWIDWLPSFNSIPSDYLAHSKTRMHLKSHASTHTQSLQSLKTFSTIKTCHDEKEIRNDRVERKHFKMIQERKVKWICWVIQSHGSIMNYESLH